MLERAKQMEELQLIINQLEEKNSQLEKINQKLLLDTTELKEENKELKKSEWWLNGQIKEMGQDIKDLNKKNEKMLEYLHMKCEVYEKDNHKLLEFQEHMETLADDIDEYPTIFNTPKSCQEHIRELLSDYVFK